MQPRNRSLYFSFPAELNATLGSGCDTATNIQPFALRFPHAIMPPPCATTSCKHPVQLTICVQFMSGLCPVCVLFLSGLFCVRAKKSLCTILVQSSRAKRRDLGQTKMHVQQNVQNKMFCTGKAKIARIRLMVRVELCDYGQGALDK